MCSRGMDTSPDWQSNGMPVCKNRPTPHRKVTITSNVMFLLDICCFLFLLTSINPHKTLIKLCCLVCFDCICFVYVPLILCTCTTVHHVYVHMTLSTNTNKGSCLLTVNTNKIIGMGRSINLLYPELDNINLPGTAHIYCSELLLSSGQVAQHF